MTQIEIVEDRQRNLRLITLRGVPSFWELMEIAEANYNGQVFANIIWDAREANFGALSNVELRRIVEFAPKNLNSRAGGKTALVVCGDTEFGIARMLEALMRTERLPFDFLPFRSMEAAQQWIFSSDALDSPAT